jgi:hypothetical protein
VTCVVGDRSGALPFALGEGAGSHNSR